jgi:hypothetical protein
MAHMRTVSAAPLPEQEVGRGADMEDGGYMWEYPCNGE